MNRSAASTRSCRKIHDANSPRVALVPYASLFFTWTCPLIKSTGRDPFWGSDGDGLIFC